MVVVSWSRFWRPGETTTEVKEEVVGKLGGHDMIVEVVVSQR